MAGGACEEGDPGNLWKQPHVLYLGAWYIREWREAQLQHTESPEGVHPVDWTDKFATTIWRIHGQTEERTRRKCEWEKIEAVTGCWSAKDNGSGCGVAIEVVDRGVWFAIFKIALQLHKCSDMQAESKVLNLCLGR